MATEMSEQSTLSERVTQPAEYRRAFDAAALPFDFIAFAIALAGAICVFVRSPTGSTGTRFRASADPHPGSLCSPTLSSNGRG